MMTKTKHNQGFTLTELIVAIVISGIVLTLVGYFSVRFNSLSKKVKAQEKRTYEQSVVVKYFDAFTNEVNLDGMVVTINYNDCFICSTNELLNTSIKVDNINKKFQYNGIELDLTTITEIKFIKMEKYQKLFSVLITFDDDSKYQFSIYIVGGINEEE